MKYRFSRLTTITVNTSAVMIDAHATGTSIELFEKNFVDEFFALRKAGGTNSIDSELEQVLYDEKVLIDTSDDEDEYLREAIIGVDKQSFSLVILPTEECNLRCIYCYEEFNSSELSQAQYDVLFNEAMRMIEHEGKKTVDVSWFGGEPLLKVDDILQFNHRVKHAIESNSLAFGSSITTNGVLLDINTFSKLRKSGVSIFQITLDGFLHDSQRVFADGSGSFETIYNNIKSIMTLDLCFRLTIRVNVPDKDFDLKFYELFSNYSGDERLSFLVKAVGKWSERDFDLPILGDGSQQIIAKHEKHIKNLGLRLNSELSKGILSGACYASYKDTYVIRANGRIGKCTVALNSDVNDVGYLDLNAGRMQIDQNKESAWSCSKPSENCLKCKKLATCYNRACPLSRIQRHSDRCCDYTQV